METETSWITACPLGDVLDAAGLLGLWLAPFCI